MPESEETSNPFFDIDDYEYLDNLPLIGWCWELGRRSSEYRNHWQTLRDLQSRADGYGDAVDAISGATVNVYDFIEHKGPFKPFYLNLRAPTEKWNPKWFDEVKHDSSLKGLVKTYNLLLRHDPFELMQIPSSRKVNKGVAKKKYKEVFRLAGANEEVTSSNEPLDDYSEMRILKYIHCFGCGEHPLDAVVQHQGKKNIIMALVDISAHDLESIIDRLRSELFLWRNTLELPKGKAPKKPKRKENSLIGKTSIWKSYIIIFDLINSHGLKYTQVSDILAKYDADTYGSEKNVENHYKQAIELIEGGYKKFL